MTRIRHMAGSDLPDLIRLLSDERVMKYLEPVFGPEKALSFLESAGMCDPPLVWAAENEDGFIGYVIFHAYDETAYEIGWVLLPEYRNRGYASSLTAELIEAAFSKGKDAVIECAVEQRVTKHVAEKFGFRRVGTREGCEVFRLERKKHDL